MWLTLIASDHFVRCACDLMLCLTPPDAPEKIPYAVKRYTNETKRLLGIYNTRLEGRDWLVGGKYSYADMCTLPWVRWVRRSSDGGSRLRGSTSGPASTRSLTFRTSIAGLSAGSSDQLSSTACRFPRKTRSTRCMYVVSWIARRRPLPARSFRC